MILLERFSADLDNTQRASLVGPRTSSRSSKGVRVPFRKGELLRTCEVRFGFWAFRTRFHKLFAGRFVQPMFRGSDAFCESALEGPWATHAHTRLRCSGPLCVPRSSVSVENCMVSFSLPARRTKHTHTPYRAITNRSNSFFDENHQKSYTQQKKTKLGTSTFHFRQRNSIRRGVKRSHDLSRRPGCSVLKDGSTGVLVKRWSVPRPWSRAAFTV